MVDIIFSIPTFFRQKTFDLGNTFCTKFLFFCVRQEISLDVSIAHDILDPDVHVPHAHTKRSFTRVVFINFPIEWLM
jgi:hypothetical protein